MIKMENKEQCYSLDNEKYYSYDDLMSDLRDIFDIGRQVEVWEADKVEWNHADFINVDDLIYNMQTNAMDVCGEVAEEYLNDIITADAEDLKYHIAQWLSKNTKLNFYGVENEKKIVVVVE